MAFIIWTSSPRTSAAISTSTATSELTPVNALALPRTRTREVRAGAKGFRTWVGSVTVSTGNSTRVDLRLQLRIVEQVVEASDRLLAHPESRARTDRMSTAGVSGCCGP